VKSAKKTDHIHKNILGYTHSLQIKYYNHGNDANFELISEKFNVDRL